ncbi:MAG: DUF4215 domain-containing protein, partial [Myxococcota bacterium]
MRYAWVSAAVGMAMLVGCFDPPTNIILRVTDPDGLAVDADTLAIGRDLEQLKSTPLRGATFPLNLTITGFEPNEVILLWVDALDDGEVVARGRTRVVFPEDGTEEFVVTLASPCNDDDDATLGCALPDAPDVSGSTTAPERGVCIAGRCGRSRCGDGVVDAGAGETCDDGNDDTQDACPDGPSGSCEPARCGDGFLYNGVEPCDDGNDVNEDSCRSVISGAERVCVVNVCGDGVVNAEIDPHTSAPFEECDDGNDIDEDACRVVVIGRTVQCVANVCGDGFVNRLVVGGDQVEDCDDQND